jgi:DHA2 family methylenomycin A resistance protein-like MFS transporter
MVGGAVAIAVFGALIANPDHINQGLRLSLGTAAALILLAATTASGSGRAPKTRPERQPGEPVNACRG